MGRRAHGECIDDAEYGELMRQTQERIRSVLAEKRYERGVSQQRLAQVIGVNREAMRDRLLGRTQTKAEEVAALAAFLDIDIREFFPEPDPGVSRAS
ncbi:MAG: helix-turn-helix transcriptional regulator [Actinomycetota bacterium]